MSRIGKLPVKIPSGVKVNQEGNVFHFQGPKGKISREVPLGVKVTVVGEEIQFEKDEKVENSSALFGLTRALFNNAVIGVHTGFEKKLEINGVGYRAQVKGSSVNLVLGFSHPVEFPLPEGVTAKVEANTKLSILGVDKEQVGAVAAKIKDLRPVEPYQGKGIRYAGEHVIRKAGKAAGK